MSSRREERILVREMRNLFYKLHRNLFMAYSDGNSKSHNLSIHLILLTILNFISHFIPFERASVAPDDYANIYSHVQNRSTKELFSYAISHTDRPLNYLFVFFQEKLLGLNTEWNLLLIFLSSSIFTLVVYFLFRRLFENSLYAFLSSIFFLLLPNKFDIYHTSIHVNFNVVFSIYCLSFLFFLTYLKEEKRKYLFLSLFSYGVAIFWYELGFLLPLLFLFYTLFFQRKKIISVLPFFMPITLYLFVRMKSEGHSVIVENILSNLFIEIPQQFIGFDMIRSIIYGLSQFPSIEAPLLWILISLDLLILALFFLWLRKIPSIILPKRLFIFSIVFIYILMGPIALYIIESRHTTLSAIGFVIFIFSAISLIPPLHSHRIKVFFTLFAIGLITSQGTAWNQAVACRINAAIFNTMKKYRYEIWSSKYVVIDQFSFAKAIPYTFPKIEKYPNNLLNFYWGNQAFALWGFPTMLHLATGYPNDSSVFIARYRIKKNNEYLQFKINTQNQFMRIPQKNTFIIDYNLVYEKGYKNGNAPPSYSSLNLN